MKSSQLTPGLVFAVDQLLRGGLVEAAQFLVKSSGLSYDNPADARLIARMLDDNSIQMRTFDFICEEGKSVRA